MILDVASRRTAQRLKDGDELLMVFLVVVRLSSTHYTVMKLT